MKKLDLETLELLRSFIATHETLRCSPFLAELSKLIVAGTPIPRPDGSCPLSLIQISAYLISAGAAVDDSLQASYSYFGDWPMIHACRRLDVPILAFIRKINFLAQREPDERILTKQLWTELGAGKNVGDNVSYEGKRYQVIFASPADDPELYLVPVGTVDFDA